MERLEVGPYPALWLEGGPTRRPLRGPTAASTRIGRLAGNTLLVERDDVLVRIEGEVSRERAIEIAESLQLGARARRRRAGLVGFDLRADLLGELDEGSRRRRAVAVAVPGDPDPSGRHAARPSTAVPSCAGVDGQERDERDADARGDQLLDGPVVVGAEDDARLEAGVAEAVLDLVDASALAVADQRHRRDLAEGRRLGPLASGESAGRTTTYGSRISSTVSNGPSPTGSITKVKSSSPRSTSSSRPPSSADSVSWTATSGQAS